MKIEAEFVHYTPSKKDSGEPQAEFIHPIRRKEDIGAPRIDVMDSKVLWKHELLVTARFNEITADALGFDLDRVQLVAKMPACSDFFVVASDKGTPLAIGGYSFDKLEGMGIVLNEDTKMVRKMAQGRRLSGRITQAAIEHTGAQFLTFHTQNPAEIASVSDSLEKGSIAPIDFDYASNGEFNTYLKIVRERFGFSVSSSGLARVCYGQKLGDYKLRKDDPKIAKINKRMLQLGLQRDRGDALLVIGKVARENAS